MRTQELLNKLKDCMVILSRIKKEILSTDVAGLDLVRQDLGIRQTHRRDKKQSNIVHGQKHGTPEKKPSVSMPMGLGRYPDSEIPLDYK